MINRYFNFSEAPGYKYITSLFALFLFIGLQQANAQLYPMGATYFQNQYLANPALAGVDNGLSINAGYRSQWNTLPGSPVLQTLTAEYALNGKVGLGLNVYNDKAGLFKRTRAVASYAYHLPLSSGEDKLHFGLSAGIMNERLSNEDIHAAPDDITLRGFNDQKAYVDGDFGLAYTGKRLGIQATLPNMKSLFGKDSEENSVDRSVFFSAISYKMTLASGANGFDLEPKVVYRGVKGYDNIADAGANLSYANNKVNLFGMYHTSQNATFGIGMNYQSFSFNGMYSSPTPGLRTYTAGNFEINLKMRILR